MDIHLLPLACALAAAFVAGCGGRGNETSTAATATVPRGGAVVAGAAGSPQDTTDYAQAYRVASAAFKAQR